MERGAKRGEERLEAGTVLVAVNPKYYRPTEVDLLIGDASKAKEKLGWEPKVKFEELVKIMVQSRLGKSAKKRLLIHRLHRLTPNLL